MSNPSGGCLSVRLEGGAGIAGQYADNGLGGMIVDSCVNGLVVSLALSNYRSSRYPLQAAWTSLRKTGCGACAALIRKRVFLHPSVGD